jgi:PAS domain S-box-containing protein
MVDRQGMVHQVEWSVRPLRDHSGQVSGLLCTGQDVTERLAVEQERHRLAAAVEQAGESIVIADSHGRITYVNPACERLGGYDSKEPHVLLEKKAAMQAIVAQVARGLVWVGRLGLTKKNGDRFMAECTVSPIRTEQGKVVAYVSLLRDITMDLRLQDHLRQSQKMEAMGTLAGGIAHDFNNILGAIIGYAELAKMNAIRPGQYEGYLDLSLRACQRAKDLVQQILTFSRQAEQEKRPVDMVGLLKESFKLLRATLPSTMEMILHVHVPVAPVLADPTQLHQVVMNLCTNAAHAMRDQGGSLEVGLRGVEVGKGDLGQYPGLEPGPYIKLSVSDQGHGMTPEVAARIFDPFFTTKAPGEGTGLGLAVAHGIVTGCGGTIRVYSEPGMGATFHVMLPMLRESKEEPQAEEREPPRGREHVLLVDDEEALVQILTRFLYDLGYRISAFTSPVEALKAFKESPHEFDLILSDLTMPNLTGVDLAQEVAAIRPGLPFLLCTGFSENITAERAKVLGIREVVLKPILRRPLAESVRRALDGASSPGAGDTP